MSASGTQLTIPVLTPEQATAFERDGYLSGIPLFSREEIARIRPAIDKLFNTPGPSGDPYVHRHLDDQKTFGISTHARLTEALAQLVGPDLILWHSRYFDKPPGAPPVPWHQDAPFWKIEPRFAISAWIALDPVDEENGCMHVIPGSHRNEIPHLRCEGYGRFGIQADPRKIDVENSLAVWLEPGEALLFDRLLLHRSGINEGDKPRLALSARYTRPDVRVSVNQLRPPVPGYGVVLVHGEDRYKLNPVYQTTFHLKTEFLL